MSHLESTFKAETLPVTLEALDLSNAPLSEVYNQFPKPIREEINGFDFHVYHMQGVEYQAKYARELYERIKREFPELKLWEFCAGPVGPHPVAQFEVDTVNPHQTGALFSWLAVNRGPCSVLVHPNTDDGRRDHLELGSWMGKSWPLQPDHNFVKH